MSPKHTHNAIVASEHYSHHAGPAAVAAAMRDPRHPRCIYLHVHLSNPFSLFSSSSFFPFVSSRARSSKRITPIRGPCSVVKVLVSTSPRSLQVSKNSKVLVRFLLKVWYFLLLENLLLYKKSMKFIFEKKVFAFLCYTWRKSNNIKDKSEKLKSHYFLSTYKFNEYRKMQDLYYQVHLYKFQKVCTNLKIRFIFKFWKFFCSFVRR